MNDEDYEELLKEAFPYVEVSTVVWESLTGISNVGKSPLYGRRSPDLVNVIDPDNVFSITSEKFRKLLPNFLFGIIFQLEEEDNPVVHAVFSNLIDYVHIEHWGDNFIERWCRLNLKQLDLVESCLDQVSDLLGEINYHRALSTLASLKILATESP